MRLLFLAPLLIIVTACAPGPESVRSPHTGVERHASAVSRLDTSVIASFDARAAMVRRDGQERWVVVTSVQRRDGDTPLVAAAWSFGDRLDYRLLDRRRRTCDLLWTGACIYEEKGEIWLSRAAFEQAAREGGLTLHLAGRRGAYEGRVPPAAFAEVLRRADKRAGR